MGLLERLYDASPIFIQNLMVTVSGYQRNRTRYGKVYYEEREFLKDFDTWSLTKKLDYQRQEFIKFIKYTYTNSKYYNELYSTVDIDNIKDIDDIKLLPIIDKEMLRANIESIITIPRKLAVEGHTGGTTGKSLIVYNAPSDSMKRMAMLDHFKSRVGFEHRKMRRATFSGKHIVPPNQSKKVYWRYNAACKQMLYSTFHITEENLAYYIKSLNKFKPHAIDGFFTCIIDIANYIERHNICLSFTPVAVFPTSETLTNTGRELIERVFNCKVYDQYASSEGAPFTTECKEQVMHVELASGVFEHLDNNSNEVLVTSFTTHGTPLIRYRIEDSMVFEENNTPCKCGIESPIVKEIQGRKLDFLYTAKGAKINAGNIANLFKNMPNALIRAQLLQDKMDEIKVYLEVDKSLYKSDYDQLLVDEFAHKFGHDTRIDIYHVDDIPREKNGKYRMIKNNVEAV